MRRDENMSNQPINSCVGINFNCIDVEMIVGLL